MDIYPVAPATKAAEQREASVAVLMGVGKTLGMGGFVRQVSDQIRLVHDLGIELKPQAVY